MRPNKVLAQRGAGYVLYSSVDSPSNACRARSACGECSSIGGPLDAACFDFLSYCQWKALSRQMIAGAPDAEAVPGWMKMHGKLARDLLYNSKPHSLSLSVYKGARLSRNIHVKSNFTSEASPCTTNRSAGLSFKHQSHDVTEESVGFCAGSRVLDSEIPTLSSSTPYVAAADSPEMWMHGEPEVVPDRNDGSALRVAVGRIVLGELRARATAEDAELLQAVSPSLDGIRSGTRAILKGFMQQGEQE